MVSMHEVYTKPRLHPGSTYKISHYVYANITKSIYIYICKQTSKAFLVPSIE
jgi:hypothetical protein